MQGENVGSQVRGHPLFRPPFFPISTPKMEIKAQRTGREQGQERINKEGAGRQEAGGLDVECMQAF